MNVPSFSLAQMSALLAALPDPVFVLTHSGLYAAIFGGTDTRYYHDGQWLVGQRLTDVLEADKADWFLQEIRHTLALGRLHVVEYSLSGHDIKGLSSEGPQEAIWFEGRVQPLDFLVLGEPAVLWVASNITARHDLEHRLRVLSETDELTGLPNRRHLMERLGSHFSAFARYGAPTSVLLFDIDEFKRINDEYGHGCGDEALRTTAAVCRRVLRSNDIATRWGGDEFVVLMPFTRPQAAFTIAERLRTDVAQALAALGSLGCGATLSAGLAEFEALDTSAEDVLQRADAGLYEAKRSGRNQTRLQVTPGA